MASSTHRVAITTSTVVSFKVRILLRLLLFTVWGSKQISRRSTSAKSLSRRTQPLKTRFRSFKATFKCQTPFSQTTFAEEAATASALSVQ